MILERYDLEATRQNALVDHLQLIVFPEYCSHKKNFTCICGICFTKLTNHAIIQITEIHPDTETNLMPPKLLIDILGWTGSILYLLAYALVSAKRTEGDSLLYQGMNIVAGVLLVIYTLYLGAYATTGLNAVWVAIGIFTLGRKWLTRN